jgi:hypothetical protein
MTTISHNGSGPSPHPAGPARVADRARGLRRFAAPAERSRAQADPEERCGLCGELVGSRHRHLVEMEHRSIMCACTACALLFTTEGAAGGRYQTIPADVRYDPAAPLTQAEWAELAIPVGMAFFFVNSALGRVVASYPSPAGVTECELDLSAWDSVAAAHPLLRAMTPDLEAVLIVCDRSSIETYLVPIDECYALAGQLRLTWQGFDGGAEGKAAIAAFLDSLRERARPLVRTG